MIRTGHYLGTNKGWIQEHTIFIVDIVFCAVITLVDLHPLFGDSRFGNGVADTVDAIACREAGGGLLAAGDALAQLIGFDGLQFSVANVHAGNIPSTLAVGMCGAGIDGLETATVVATNNLISN